MKIMEKVRLNEGGVVTRGHRWLIGQLVDFSFKISDYILLNVFEYHQSMYSKKVIKYFYTNNKSTKYIFQS